MEKKLIRPFVRFYSANNLGDDLFIKILAERYLNSFSVYGPSVPCQDKNNIVPVTHKFMDRVVGKLARKFPCLVVIEKLLRRANREDILIYIGGSIFKENTGSEYWAHEDAFYKRLQIPYYFVGASFGPYESESFLLNIRHIVKSSVHSCFRDKASFELFADLGNVSLGSDVVFTLNTSEYREVPESQRVIISVIDTMNRFDQRVASEYDSLIVRMATSYIRQGKEVYLFSFCEAEGDATAIDRIQKLMDPFLSRRVKKFSYTGNIDQALGLIASAEFIVGSRFHASILGFVFGKKTLPIIYDEKTRNILTDLDFQGLTIDLQKDELTELIDISLDRFETADVSSARKNAELQFADLDNILDLRDE